MKRRMIEKGNLKKASAAVRSGTERMLRKEGRGLKKGWYTKDFDEEQHIRKQQTLSQKITKAYVRQSYITWAHRWTPSIKDAGGAKKPLPACKGTGRRNGWTVAA